MNAAQTTMKAMMKGAVCHRASMLASGFRRRTTLEHEATVALSRKHTDYVSRRRIHLEAERTWKPNSPIALALLPK